MAKQGSNPKHIPIEDQSSRPGGGKWLQRLRELITLAVAVGLTIGFYSIVHLPWFVGSTIHHYTTGHPVEYLSMALTFWALCMLGAKAVGFAGQRAALHHHWFPESAAGEPEAPERSATLLHELHTHAGWYRHTWLAQRLRAGLRYVYEKRSAIGLEEHLKYLADQAADQSHRGYGLVRIISWMIPILGFLGTVLGITLAIGNLTPDQLESSLTTVTAGLAVAFDTTALALCLSILLMLATYFVERTEQQLLSQVDAVALDYLAHRFQASDPQHRPYLQALHLLGETIVTNCHRLVQTQVELWSQAVQGLRVSQEEFHRHHHEQLQAVVGSLHLEGQQQWQTLQSTAGQILQAQQGLQVVAERLTILLEGREQLTSLQQILSRNLETLHQSQQLEEAMHTLSAAVHLMTARTKPGTTARAESQAA